MISVVVMAHPARRARAERLAEQLDCGIVWDRRNDRWDTGRRAMLDYDPAAHWHLVVQDDVILCRNFRTAAERALEACPDGPVSFYTGKTRPYAAEVNRAVAKAAEMGRRWIAMRGPLWGPAVAVPTRMIDAMIEGADHIEHPNYDLRMSEWFHGQGYRCWYSQPSLVDHLVGPGNPSLVPGRGAGMTRVAHSFVGPGDPLQIDWQTAAYAPGDPSEPWRKLDERLVCTACGLIDTDLAEMIEHAAQEHELGPFDFVATTPGAVRAHLELMGQLHAERIGQLFIVGRHLGEHAQTNGYSKRVVRKADATRTLRGGPWRFTICGNRTNLALLGPRAGWSLDGWSN